MSEKMEKRILSCEEDTWAWAESFAQGVKPGDVLGLCGDLGAGKTSFVRGLAHALGVREPVRSPTYTLVNEYEGILPIYHLDGYRLADPMEALGLGLDEVLDGEGLTVIEWADRLVSLLPERTLWFYLEHGRTAEERIGHRGGPPS